MSRQEFYCSYCDSEFLIDSPTISPINYCANCGAETEVEDMEDDDGWDE